MERQDSEEREDWSGSSWDGEYEILQQYDKNGPACSGIPPIDATGLRGGLAYVIGPA